MRGLLIGMIVFMLAACTTIEKKEEKFRIKKTVNRENAKLNYCYRKAMESEGSLEGEVTLQWDIDYSSGQEKIDNIQVQKSTVDSKMLLDCMKTVVAKMRFGLPLTKENRSKTIQVSYPFVFKDNAKSVTR